MDKFLDSLTLNEVDFYETQTNQAIGELYDSGKIGKSTLVLYYLFKKRSNPDFTLADAGNITPVAALAELETYTPKVVPGV